MPELVEVRFKGNRRAYFTWERADALPIGTSVIVDVSRGADLGTVTAVGDTAARKCAVGCAGCGLGSPRDPDGKVLRRAAAEESHLTSELRKAEEDVRRTVGERVAAHGLAMKISDAEWQWDRKKLTVYFTADKRVDFRALVRDLASLFRTRIELRQIGARDEAKRLEGVGRCGREYCCSSWLPELRPVSLSLAKDQRLSLNPSQISGGCGRLLCCLRYEHEFYVSSRKRFPKEGKVIVTARGPERVQAVDIFRERVLLRGEDGTARAVALAALREEISGVPPGPPGAPTPRVPAAPEPHTDDQRDAIVTAERAVDAIAPKRPRKRRRRGRRGGSGRHRRPQEGPADERSGALDPPPADDGDRPPPDGE